MGGYVLEDGRKLQTDEYIEHLEGELEHQTHYVAQYKAGAQALERERDQLLEKLREAVAALERSAKREKETSRFAGDVTRDHVKQLRRADQAEKALKSLTEGEKPT